MQEDKHISGFSRLSREQKTDWLQKTFNLDDAAVNQIHLHLHTDRDLQKLYEEFSENTISNFFIPYGLAPNFLINDTWYVLPMAIEESSVVAAASHAAKFWSTAGGFKAEVTDTIKIGQVHFSWDGDHEALVRFFHSIKKKILSSIDQLTGSMKKRGGGIRKIELIVQNDSSKNYYRLQVSFNTVDAMGANFINTIIEELGIILKEHIEQAKAANLLDGRAEVIMAILSNYTPESLVSVCVETDVSNLDSMDPALSGLEFARKFVLATDIARIDPYRAVTHNKGIFNGMDAVVIATGNDFRAVEACGHAYASRNGSYMGLSKAGIEGSTFRFALEVPMAVGTIGGLTGLHPLAGTSLQILGNPSAEKLMMIIAAAGLATNFSAVMSLITGGIQKGHMKMHLSNILRLLDADETQKQAAIAYFKDRTVSYNEVREFLEHANS